MANQNSIICYVPQPYFRTGAYSITAYTAISSIENTAGIFDPDLSNYTTVIPTSGSATFAVQIGFAKQSSHLAATDMTVGLIGCSLLTYENDGGSPDLDTEFSENVSCLMSSNIGSVASELFSFAHNSQDSIDTFNQTPMPSVISGGRTNLIFNGLGYSSAGSTATMYVTIERTAAAAAARPHAKLIIGHLFVGVDLPVIIDPRVFAWTLEIENQRFIARDFGAIPSDGTLVKRAVGEFIKMVGRELIGSTVTGVSPVAVSSFPNFFDLTKVNTSYPLLFNPYPADLIVESTLTVDQANLTARQNFFSIYGYMPDPMEVQTDDYRDGLNSEYRARFRIEETR